MITVAPSLLSADFTRLAEDIQDMEQAGADWHHVDVMDGHFVPNLAFSPALQGTLGQVANLTIDTHLMVTHPSKLFDAFQKAGSEWITVHVECEENIHELLKNIKARGIKCGLSLKPGTPIENLEPYLQDLDLVLVMTVEPGFGGQSFMENMVKKVAWLHTQRTEGKGDYLIEVDGGINVETGGLCAAAGADVLVSGSYLYGSKERSSNIKAMKQLPHPSSTQAD